MSKVIKGTKDLRTVRVIKGQKDTRQLRCPNCKELATQVPDGKGGTMTKCPSCQSTFNCTRI